MRKRYDGKIKFRKKNIHLNTRIYTIRNLTILDVIGRIVLILVSVMFWLYVILTPIYYEINLDHLTNWGLIMGFIYYNMLVVGSFITPILRYGLLIMMTTYHAFLYLICIGILVVIAYNPTIIQNSIDTNGLSKVRRSVNKMCVFFFYFLFFHFTNDLRIDIGGEFFGALFTGDRVLHHVLRIRLRKD